MATKFEKVLDTVHDAAATLERVTAPKKKKIDRDTVIKIFNITTTIVGAVALLIPQVKALTVAANVLTALGRTAGALVPNETTETSTVNPENNTALVPTEK